MAVFVTRKEHIEFFKTEKFEAFKHLTFNQVEGELLFKSIIEPAI